MYPCYKLVVNISYIHTQLFTDKQCETFLVLSFVQHLAEGIRFSLHYHVHFEDKENQHFNKSTQ